MERDDPAGIWRRAVTVALLALVVQLPGVASPAAAQVAAAADRKIDAGLLALPDDNEVDFWVTFTAKADLRPAGRANGWSARGQAVVDGLQQTAKSNQAGVANLLAARRIRFDRYWVANTGKVTGPKSLMRQLAARPEVATVSADQTIELPEPAPAAGAAPAAVDWNVAAVNAPAVWNDIGVTGQGIVVANLDTGVQFDHPALVNQYRGNLGGAFDHNYNWFDPSNVCGTPSVVPCDNNRHGTHTMGTILGDDGTGQNRIGVAPGARWIAAKGCESSSCSQSALLASGQWLLAPTDLSGQNPRPDLRPNVVNNSWAGGSANPWYQPVVQAWVAAGIFPVFANGNSGPSCGTAGSPGDYAESYAVGAHTSDGRIASFSSRSSTTGVMKPDIAAPGENVRSSVPGSAYTSLSGSSMAAPHVAGVVALMWSAAPSLIANVALTRQILDETAFDVSDLTCGGTSADNGVWGEGRLDALAAVLRSPHGPLGTISGTVADQATGLPVAGAQVRSVLANTFPRVATTSATGTFTQLLPAGTAQVQVTAYGYGGASTEAAVADKETKGVNFSLVPLPRHSLSGRVVDYIGAPVAAASVSIVGGPAQAVVTDAGGLFGLAAVPAGDQALSASGGFCLAATTKNVHDGDTTVEIALPIGRDAFGYSCRQTAPAYVEARTPLDMTGNDTYLSVPLPFPFSYYGTTYGSASVSTNGLVGLGQGSSSWNNRAIPDAAVPNATIYAFWDDLYVDGLSSVRTEVLGTEPGRRFVIEWRNVRFSSGTAARFDFEVILDQRGGIELQYRGLTDDPLVKGASATIGIENATGTVGRPYSYNQVALRGSAMGLRFETLASAGNTAPDAVADTATTVAGREVRIPVLANDRDPDGDPLDVTGVSAPQGSGRVLDGDVVSYTPGFNLTGTVVLTYDLTDGRGGTDRATITLTVVAFAVDDTASTAEDTPVEIAVLSNDLNPQGGTLAIYAVYGPPRGSAQAVSPGVVRYIPAPNFNGYLTIEYAVSDGLGGLDEGAITITVSPVDDPPRPGNDRAQVAQDGVTTISVLANDFDDDGDVLQVVAVSDPPHGAAVVNPDGTVTYRPDAGYAGTDAFAYDVSDGRTVAQATVTMTVIAPTTIITSTSTTTTTIPPTTTTTVPPTTTTTVPPTTTTTNRPPGTATMRAPYSVWTQASPSALDGVGTWLATVNDPAGRAGQLAANYLYGLSFGFASSPARGFLGLATGPGGKTASLTVIGPAGPPQVATVPFPWTANGVYFMFVHQYGPGSWSAAIYDYSNSTWTPIGTLTLPVAWGKLAPTTVTASSWTESPAGTCAAYPAADVLVHAPVGYLAGGGSYQTFVQGGTTAGVCASQHVNGPPGWVLYRTGTP
jgi:subtilisin family serine protease